MPSCAKCGHWVSSLDKVCGSCGHRFGFTSPDPRFTGDLIPDPEPAISKSAEAGEVYLLKSGKHYKIGRTNLFERRFKEIKLQLPFSVEEIHCIRTNNVALLENHWHERFRLCRKNGEWFQLSEADVREFTSMKEVLYY